MTGNLFSAVAWTMALPDSSIFGGFMVVALIVRFATSSLKAGKVDTCDIAALAYLFVQFVVLGARQLPSNAIHFITPLTAALCIYYIVRLTSFSKNMFQSTLYAVVGFALVLATCDILLFGSALRHFSLFRRSDISSLHAGFPLLGGPTRNDGAMMLLALLPYAFTASLLDRSDASTSLVYLGRFTTLMLVSAMVLSFSRGIYTGLAVFGVAAVVLLRCYDVVPLRRLLKSASTLVVLVGVVIIGCRVQTAFIDTITGSRTVSEQRSTSGRITIWIERFDSVKRHPLLGLGGYSDGVIALASRKKTPNLPFEALAYNAPLDVLLSSGLLGFLAYGTFLLYPIVMFFRSPRRARGERTTLLTCLVACLVAMLVRDLTFSSLVIHGATVFVTWLTVGVIRTFTINFAS
jgi:O-antigen ligase